MNCLPTETALVFILDWVCLHTYAPSISLQLWYFWVSPLNVPSIIILFLTLPSPWKFRFTFGSLTLCEHASDTYRPLIPLWFCLFWLNDLISLFQRTFSFSLILSSVWHQVERTWFNSTHDGSDTEISNCYGVCGLLPQDCVLGGVPAGEQSGVFVVFLSRVLPRLAEISLSQLQSR